MKSDIGKYKGRKAWVKVSGSWYIGYDISIVTEDRNQYRRKICCNLGHNIFSPWWFAKQYYKRLCRKIGVKYNHEFYGDKDPSIG